MTETDPTPEPELRRFTVNQRQWFVEKNYGEWARADDALALLRARDECIAKLQRKCDQLCGDPAGGPSSIVGRAYHQAIVRARDETIANERKYYKTIILNRDDEIVDLGYEIASLRAERDELLATVTLEIDEPVDWRDKTIASLRAERDRLREACLPLLDLEQQAHECSQFKPTIKDLVKLMMQMQPITDRIRAALASTADGGEGER